jgi:hypothetical protein
MTEEPAGRHQLRIEALRAAVFEGPGVLSPDHREAAARNAGVGGRYGSFVDAIHRHAYRITDRTIVDLHAAGASDEEIFEIAVAAGYGAAFERYETGLRALRAADLSERERG